MTPALHHVAIALVALSIASPSLAQPVDWPNPVANDVIPYETTGLTHGPLLGGVTANSVRLWIRTREATRFEVVYDTRLPLDENSPQVTGETTAARDLTGVVELNGLAPHTRYFYGVRINAALADIRLDTTDPWPSFRTLPDRTTYADPKLNPRGLFNVTFAVGHCASQEATKSGGQYASTPAYDTILREHQDEALFAIVNGDVIYEENRDGTLDGVRQNYRTYFARGRSFNALFRRVPGLFTFDDHDVGWDLHGSGQIGLGEGPHLIRDTGLKAYEENLAWANFRGPHSGRIRFGTATVEKGATVLVDPAADFTTLDPRTVSTIHLGNYTSGSTTPRRKEAPRNAGVYGLTRVIDATHLEFTPPARADETLPYSLGTHHFYDWRMGNCHFFALDTRGERSNRNPKDRSDAKLFILGDVQKRWLTEGITKSDADFVFLISPDPWTIYHTAAHVSDAPGADEDDKGDGFPSFLHEREELIAFLDTVDKPVLIFTGDVHASASVKITDNVWGMMCGPLGSTGHPIATLGNPPRGGRWQSMGRDVEVRWVTGFPNDLPYQRIRNTYYGLVQVNNVLEVGTPDGRGTRCVAYDSPQVIVRWHDGYTGRLAYAETISPRDARTTVGKDRPRIDANSRE
jgi:alkaline phosphatase D